MFAQIIKIATAVVKAASVIIDLVSVAQKFKERKDHRSQEGTKTERPAWDAVKRALKRALFPALKASAAFTAEMGNKVPLFTALLNAAEVFLDELRREF